MNRKPWLVVYAVGWVAWMLGFAVLDANGVLGHGDIFWALAGATLWPVALPLTVLIVMWPV